MTALRQKMIEAMRQRGFAQRTHQTYLHAVEELARYFRRSPAELDAQDLQRYFEHLVQERNLSAASCRVHFHGVRFLYLRVLQWPAVEARPVIPKRPQRIPQLLTRGEVRRILLACENPKHRTMLALCYGCGLRVGEVCRLQVSDIDGERRQLRIEQGKGAKDRFVVLPPSALEQLRRYWSTHRPRHWLFPNSRFPQQPLGISSLQKVYTRAKNRAGVERLGGIHGLRHAYATHMLEQGVPVHQLQYLLGHRSLRTTTRYLHWLPGRPQPGAGPTDVLASLGVARD